MKGLPDKELLRVEEVADYFSVTNKTIYLWIENDHLVAEKIAGSVVRITRESVLKCRFPHHEN
jgi:excisionase family DNA binding protein